MKILKLTIILIICGYSSLIFSQETSSDVQEYYWNGNVDYDRNNLEREKSYQNKMIFLQLKYENGSISKEFFRVNDSTFLYTEYYNATDINLDSYWNIGKKREGHLEITNKVSGDTITVIDFDTFDDSIYLDTLLLPTGEWKYFHENGKLKHKGKFNKNVRSGTWKFYDKFNNRTKEIEYNNGKIENIILENIILKESISQTSKAILGNWILRPSYINGEQNKQAEIDSLNILYKVSDIDGLGDIYSFHSNNKCTLTETHIVETEYKKGDGGLNIMRKYDILRVSQGHWRLNSNNGILIDFKNRKDELIIEYISDTQLRIIKKEKALNIE